MLELDETDPTIFVSLSLYPISTLDLSVSVKIPQTFDLSLFPTFSYSTDIKQTEEENRASIAAEKYIPWSKEEILLLHRSCVTVSLDFSSNKNFHPSLTLSQLVALSEGSTID